ncbi:MAG: hypothetical protein QG641_2107 [Candidatus Poribacteria bacterium]|nr:hypothetical protein [Candidatus Poribacteria bacterium]
MKTLEEVDEKVTSLETTLERFITYHDLVLSRLERETEESRKLIEKNDKHIEATDRQIERISKLIEENSKQIKENDGKIEETRKLIEENNKQIKESDNESDKKFEETRKLIEKYSKENRDQIKENNKQWGALAKKMGTIDEDLVAPATRPVMKKYFGCEPIDRTIRFRRRSGGESFEVDVLVVCETQVFMIEVKSTPKSEHVEEILEKVKDFKRFFPEYENKQVIPIFAGIVFPDEIVKYATKKGLYIMAYREWEYMDIINFNEIERKK